MIEKVPNVVTEYPFKQQFVAIETRDSADVDLLHKRCADSFAEFGRMLNTELYGDKEPPRIKTRWERFSDRLGLYRSRIRDAWDVLTGKAEIGDGW